MFNITRNLFENLVEGYINLSKELDGDLVILNKKTDEADEFIIGSLKDLELLKISENDLLEVTIYVDDEDEVYEEFVIGNGKDNERVLENILKKLPEVDIKNISLEKEAKENKKNESNHFQKFYKKK